MQRLTASQARAIALAAQGFTAQRPREVDAGALRSVVARLGAVQIDSVNVLVRAHYLPVFSRLGAYPPSLLDAESQAAPRSLFEYWGHEASLLPVTMQPLFRWRMALAERLSWSHVRRVARRKPELVRDVLAEVTRRGPLGAGEVSLGEPGRKGFWEWSEAKSALEFLFFSGEVTTARRRGFERLYDLTSRVLPAEVLAAPTPADDDAHRALIDAAARALGIATEADLRDYFRMKPEAARPAVRALVEAGALAEVEVLGWGKHAYLHRDASAPTPVAPDLSALVSPFDSLVWSRDRTERLFGMKLRLEIYVPAPKRVHGYYVLPFLLGDRLVARVDLKADRKSGALRVRAAHPEPGAPKAAAAAALSRELTRMAGWLGLDRVEVAPEGELAAALGRALRPAASRPRPESARRSGARRAGGKEARR